jgi:2',3'-cyclic-nucleotide 2'-phosphodiesterase (5'-nucleotidase family)
VFDRETRKLVGVNVQTVKMDKSVALDPMIIGATQKEVAASEAELKKPIGELAVRLAFRPERPGTAAPSLKLITAAIRHSLGKRKVTVDGVLHGLFLDDKDVAAGSKTIADAWEIIPYENRLATAAIRGADLVPVMQEVLGAPFSTHALEGFRVESEGEGRGLKVKAVTLADGKPVEPEKRYVIGLNAFDAQSGGRRYELLAELVQQSDAALTLHAVESRDALIEFFTEKGTVRLADLV